MIYQIQISLNGSKPKIWRRLLIPADLLLSDFHKLIQTTMGWTNSHLHQFIKLGIFYSQRYENDDYWEEMDNVDYSDIKVFDLLQKEKESITYEYDFGDSWEHTILLEKILPNDEKSKLPICLAGKMNCPPEDCGGIWGYAAMLDILTQPDHEEYEHCYEWFDDDFDPKHFDKDEINQMLNDIDYGNFEF